MDYLKLALELSKVKHQMSSISSFRKILEVDNGKKFVLGYLDESACPVIPKDIGGAMNVSSARVAAILNQLEVKGMVRRKPNPNNGRYTVIELLPDGKIQRQKNINDFNQQQADLLESLGPDDALEYVRLQKKIADIYSNNSITRKKDHN